MLLVSTSVYEHARILTGVGVQAAGSIDDLRAIPWIFAWTQTRLHLPVWLGIGGAFKVRPPPLHLLGGCTSVPPR